MGLEGLKAVIAKYEENPEKANGFSSGGYSIDYDKIWRGNTVIGYADDKAGIENPDIPKFLPTSKTSREEGDCFAASAAVAPPEPASPPMSITSPEGAQSEEQPPAPGGEAGGEAGEAGGEPSASPEGEAGQATDLGSLGAELSSEAPVKGGGGGNPDDFASRKNEPGVDPLGFGKEKTPTRENLEVLASARLEETRRKYFKATAALEFDIEAKSVTGGESVCLYLLPTLRSEGKYELYDFTVTKTSSIPSAFAVRQAVASSVAEAIPHVMVNRSQLEMISRRVHSAMKAAKDDCGGFNGEESVTEAIDRYFMEDF
jgi:hypothetical protein